MADQQSNGLWRRLVMRASAVDRRALLGVFLAVGIAAGGVVVPAFGQSWWPFDNDAPPRPRAPVPNEPVFDGAAGEQPRYGQGNSICLELEQRLVQDGQRGNDSRNLIPMVEQEMRQAEQAYRGQKQELDRANCYEYFLFSKTLKRSRRCVDLANQADDTRRRIDDLEVQLSQLQGSSGKSYQDEIIRELARNNCGASYQQQARQQRGGFSNFWDDGESSGYSGGGSSFGALPYATYRTVCVRLCDGYYFPVSFSTLPNHFQRDEEVCHSKCASPASLYYHQNPGAGMDQALEARSNVPYTELKSAFLYRKEYVNGCSCKMAEYTPAPGEAPPSGAPAGDAGGWSTEVPTGATPEQAPSPPPGSGEHLPWSTSP